MTIEVLSCETIEKLPIIIKARKKVLTFLEHNPSSLGHGYSHFIETARESVVVAFLRGEDPVNAYLAGLLHDLHRPALGEAGKEDQSATVEEARSLLRELGLCSEDVEEIALTTGDNNDKMILEGKASGLMVVVSLADKRTMTFQRGVAYCWASNRSLKELGKPERYGPLQYGVAGFSGFEKIKDDFLSYQKKARAVFAVVGGLGLGSAIEAYDLCVAELGRVSEAERKGMIAFWDLFLETTRAEALKEKAFLESEGLSDQVVEKIGCSFAELWGKHV